MRRYLTLSAAIISIGFPLVYVILNVIKATSFMSLVMGGVVKFITILVAAYAALTGFFSLTAFACTHETYRRKYRSLFQAILFNGALAGLLIYGMIKTFDTYSIFVIIASITAVALYITDMFLEKKRVLAHANKYGQTSAKSKATEEPVTEEPAKESTEQTAEEPTEEPTAEPTAEESTMKPTDGQSADDGQGETPKE